MKKFLLLLLFFCTCFVSLLIVESNGGNVGKLMMDKVLEIVNIESIGEVVFAEETMEDLYVSYHVGYTLLKSGRLKEFSDKKRIISEKIYVEGNSVYYFKNLSAKYGNSFYVIYDSNNKVISYLGTDESSTGEVIENLRVIMPENASYFRIACDLNVNNKMFDVVKSNEVVEDGTDTNKGDKGENLDEEEFKVNDEVSINALEDIEVLYHAGYTLLKNGRLKEFSNKKRIISEKIYVEPNSIYFFDNLSAKYGNSFYVIYDSNNKVIKYLGTNASSTGDIIESIRVIMPKNASYFRIACDLNISDKMFRVRKSSIKASLNDKTGEPAIISFIDDDCRKEFSEVLYPTIAEKKIPYTLACPLDNLGKVRYITKEKLKTYYDKGINVLSHHLKEEAMTYGYKSFDAYKEDTIKALKGFRDIGIELSGIAYPNGLINPNYMSIVKDYYKFGFTIDRNINTLPYESHHIHRYELFSQNGIYGLNDAKKLVDSVADNGGWLVFMTHSWYETFSSEDLESLVDYIRNEKNIPILDVASVIENYSNPIEMGIIKKPFKDEVDDFFVVDALGRVSTNNTKMSNIESSDMKVYDKSLFKLEEIPVSYDLGSSLGPNGYLQTPYVWEELIKLPKEEQIPLKRLNVSKFIPVTANSKYKLVNLSAKKGNCFYVFYDSKYNTIGPKGISDLTTGEVLTEKIITIPSGVTYIRIASNLNIYDKLFKLYRVSNNDEVNNIIDVDSNSYLTDNSNNDLSNNSNNDLKGDLNSDGEITNDDLSMLYLYISGICEFNDEELLLSDVNDDGKVNNKDWNKLYNIINESS